MALVVKDRVKETTSTTGTSTLTLGGAVAGFQTFTSVLSNGDTTYYAIFESSTGQFEVGLGTFTSSGTTLARTTVLESSNSGNAINLTAGAADVFITQPAEKAVYLDASGYIATSDGRNVTNVAASTAATLATARNIGGVSFDGSANINLPGVNTSGNQDTSGNAATATQATNADTVDSLHASSFLRSDAADSASGTITVATGTDPAIIAKSDDWGEQLEIIRNHATNWPSVKFSTTAGEKGKVFVDTSNNYLMYVKGGTSNYETVWTSLTDGSGSGLDADLLDGVQGSSYLRSDTDDTFTGTLTLSGNLDASSHVVTGSIVNGNSYVYTPNIYLTDTIYHSGDGDTYINFQTDEIRLTAGGSQEVTVNTTGVRLGDTGNGYFQPVSGDYGSIQIDGGAHNSYEGYSIGGRVVFMHNNSDTTYLFNDVDNEAFIRMYNNGGVALYFNGSVALETSSTGVNVTGTAEVDTLKFSDNSTQTSAGASTGKAIAMAIVFG